MTDNRGHMSEEDLVKGIGSMAGDSSPAGGSSPVGAPADDVSQAELVRQFGDEFRRSMQAAIDRQAPAGAAVSEKAGKDSLNFVSECHKMYLTIPAGLLTVQTCRPPSAGSPLAGSIMSAVRGATPRRAVLRSLVQ